MSAWRIGDLQVNPDRVLGQRDPREQWPVKLIGAPISPDAPQGLKAVPPVDVLAFLVRATVITDGHFVDA